MKLALLKQQILQELKDTPRSEYCTRQIIMHFTHINECEYYLGEKEIEKRTEKQIRSCCEKRKDGTPLSYCLGVADFMGLTFSLGKGALIPRPETELLVEEVLEIFKATPFINFADWCSGTGCIGIAILKLRHSGRDFCTFVEKSTRAIKWNNINLQAFGLEKHSKILQNKNVTDADFSPSSLDLITANPPYIKESDLPLLMPEVRDFEPRMALNGGKDGITIYKKLIKATHYFLKDGGILAMETAGAMQISILEKFWRNNFELVKIIKDYANIPRHLILKNIKQTARELV